MLNSDESVSGHSEGVCLQVMVKITLVVPHFTCVLFMYVLYYDLDVCVCKKEVDARDFRESGPPLSQFG